MRFFEIRLLFIIYWYIPVLDRFTSESLVMSKRLWRWYHSGNYDYDGFKNYYWRR